MWKWLIGKRGENKAADYLKRLNFRIIDTNINYHKFGELDIVAKKDDILYFFEVRTTTKGYYSPLETIDSEKRERFIRAAELYMTQCNWEGPCELGYIGVDESKNPPNIEVVFDTEL